MRILRPAIAGLALLVAQLSWAQGWLVTPARHEMLVRPGETSTYVVRLEREAVRGTPPGSVRFSGTPGDWDISRTGEVILGPAQSMPLSACGWLAFSPASFTLPPAGLQQIRVSVSVPPETPPGVYRAGLFFEEHSVVPPRQGAGGQMVIRYRLSSLIYVMVPKLERKFALHDIEVRPAPDGGWSVRAVFDNPGTLHLRPEHWVEVRDPNGQLLLRTDPLPTMVVLPGHQLEVELAVRKPLPPAERYEFRYLVDAARELPLQARTLSWIPTK